MLFVSYAVFLSAVGFLLGRAVAERTEPSVRDWGYGSLTRGVMLVTSLLIFLVTFPTALDQDHTSTEGNAIWAGLVVGSALYSAGAASWTGGAAFWLRGIGWILMVFAFVVPSTLSLGLPLAALLAFAVVPISTRRTTAAHAYS